MMWVVTVMSLVGVVLNIKKRKECFYVWGVTNFAWMVYDFYIGAYSQSFLFAVYFLLAVWGIYEWNKELIK